MASPTVNEIARAFASGSAVAEAWIATLPDSAPNPADPDTRFTPSLRRNYQPTVRPREERAQPDAQDRVDALDGWWVSAPVVAVRSRPGPFDIAGLIADGSGPVDGLIADGP